MLLKRFGLSLTLKVSSCCLEVTFSVDGVSILHVDDLSLREASLSIYSVITSSSRFS